MRWGEMDIMGHMNNVSYFRYFEESRVAWFERHKGKYDSSTESPILGSISCRFVQPAVYPVLFQLTSFVGNLGRSSFVMWSELRNANHEQICFAEAEATMVWINTKTGKSQPLPDWLREIC